MSDEIIKKSQDIWRFKLAIARKEGKIKTNYNIISNLDNFEINKVYINIFLTSLWNYPEAVFCLLKNINEPNISKHLSRFFINYFYKNYMNNNSLENNLLYLITMMLKEEIDKLKSLDEIDTFLDKSKASFLLEEIINFPDVKLYFKKTIIKVLKKVENNFFSRRMNFNMNQTCQNIKNFIHDIKKKFAKEKNMNHDELCKMYIRINLMDHKINSEEYDDVDEKDIIDENLKFDLGETFLENTNNINKSVLDELAKNAEKNNKNDLKLFYTSLSDDITKKNIPDLYSNVFMDKFYEDEEVNIKFLLYIYQFHFLNMISLLNELIEDLLNKVSIIPNSIKYICKVISLLIKNKFKDVPKHIENKCISKFFAEKLLIPVLKSPSFNACIGGMIISDYTLDNLSIMTYIIKNFFSGNLFQNNSSLSNGDAEKYYTIFNRYILNNYEKVLLFNEKAVNISIPSFIEKYINNTLPSDYRYDYFKENPEEICTSISICFNINDLIYLIKEFKKSENEFFSVEDNKYNKFKRIFNKLKYDDKIEELKKYDIGDTTTGDESNDLDNNKNKKIIKPTKSNAKKENYYIFNEIEIEENYKNIFKINNKIKGFYIDLKKIEKDRILDEKEKNLIKFKNYLSNLLRNYKALKRSSLKSTKDIKTIFSQLKKQIKLPQLNKGYLTLNWSVNFVVENMEKIPEEYKENEYEKFFEELTNELEESISKLDFEKLFKFKKNLEFIREQLEFYRKNLRTIEEISNNIKMKTFIENYFLPIELTFIYDDKEQIFDIKKLNNKEKSLEDIIIPEKGKVKIPSISLFIKYFPNLNVYHDLLGINPFELIRDLSINKKLFQFFDIVKYSFIEHYHSNEEKYASRYELKMKNYIMLKIYDKIYPKEFDNEDYKLFQKTIHLSWVEPNMIIKDDFALETLDKHLPEIIFEFKRLNIVRCPYTKFLCIQNIFKLLRTIVKFNEGEEGYKKNMGTEEVTQYLNFVLIKGCPINIFSNIKFIKLFLKDGGKKEYDLLNFEKVCQFILNSTYKDYNVTEEEYIKNCNEIVDNTNNNNDKRFNEIINRCEDIIINN